MFLANLADGNSVLFGGFKRYLGKTAILTYFFYVEDWPLA
jgi:hypothetical protein